MSLASSRSTPSGKFVTLPYENSATAWPAATALASEAACSRGSVTSRRSCRPSSRRSRVLAALALASAFLARLLAAATCLTNSAFFFFSAAGSTRFCFFLFFPASARARSVALSTLFSALSSAFLASSASSAASSASVRASPSASRCAQKA